MDSTAVRHLYLHIPFCPAKCPYCAFVTHVGSTRLVGPYVEAVQREIDSIDMRRHSQPLSTVYLGGGTPSMLTPAQIASILAVVRDAHGLEPGAEITMEAHPGTVDLETLQGFHSAGATRISFGGESLHADELSLLKRGHSADRILAAVDEARTAGFTSVNVDLIYGLPGQDVDRWSLSLERLMAVRPDHVSLYPLQIEPGTVFGRRYREGLLRIPDDEAVVAMYEEACAQLQMAGYAHYEVANWALPGHECRHNLAYWLDREYLGAGVGAHAYVHPYRTENLRSTARYIEAIAAGTSPVASRELIDRSTELSERVVLGLRLLMRGLDLAALEVEFGAAARGTVTRLAAPALERGDLRMERERLYLAEQAVPIANEILDEFVLLDLPQTALRSA